MKKILWKIVRYRKPRYCEVCGKKIVGYLINNDLGLWLSLTGENYYSFVDKHADIEASKGLGICLECEELRADIGYHLWKGYITSSYFKDAR